MDGSCHPWHVFGFCCTWGNFLPPSGFRCRVDGWVHKLRHDGRMACNSSCAATTTVGQRCMHRCCQSSSVLLLAHQADGLSHPEEFVLNRIGRIFWSGCHTHLSVAWIKMSLGMPPNPMRHGRKDDFAFLSVVSVTA